VDNGWQNFLEDGNNQVQSGSEIQGSCPQIDDSIYTAGLTAGNFCVQLTIADGGPNDADGVANGAVRDPGGIAVFAPDLTPPVLTIPADITVEALDENGTPGTNSAIQTYLDSGHCEDSVDGELVVTTLGADVDLGQDSTTVPVGSTRVTFSCVDGSNNLTEATGTISVVDTTPPELTIPDALIIEADGVVAAFDSRIADFLAAASCTDAVSVNPQVTTDAPSTFSFGTTSVTFTCQDEAMNNSDATVAVTISQTQQSGWRTSSPGGGGGAGCFIATAAYGSYLDPHVMTLREFRDDYLLTTRPGVSLVHSYYKYSPPIADLIARNELLRTATRGLLTPIVYLIAYPGPVLGGIALVLWHLLVRRRKYV
jgi:hypothetical protein